MKFDVDIIRGPFDDLYHLALIKNNESVVMLNETIARAFGIPEREYIDRIVSKVVFSEGAPSIKSIFYFKKKFTNEQYIENFKNEFIKELTTLNLK